MGVAVTFIALLELLRAATIEVVQAEAFAPLHVRAASSVRLVDGEEEPQVTAANETDTNPESE